MQRKRFILRLLLLHHKDVRIEQLAQEKERLEFERALAVQRTRPSPGVCSAAAADPLIRPEPRDAVVHRRRSQRCAYRAGRTARGGTGQSSSR